MHFNYTNYCYNVIVCPWMYTCTCNLKKKTQHMHKNIRISGFVNLVIDFPQAISIHKLFFLWINRLCFLCKLTKYIHTLFYQYFWYCIGHFDLCTHCFYLMVFWIVYNCIIFICSYYKIYLGKNYQSVITQDWSLKDLNFM